jgi:hypothetical protein
MSAARRALACGVFLFACTLGAGLLAPVAGSAWAGSDDAEDAAEEAEAAAEEAAEAAAEAADDAARAAEEAAEDAARGFGQDVHAPHARADHAEPAGRAQGPHRARTLRDRLGARVLGGGQFGAGRAGSRADPRTRHLVGLRELRPTAGDRRQYAIVVPSHDLVIVRRGLDWSRQGFDEWDLSREVLKAFPRR